MQQTIDFKQNEKQPNEKQLECINFENGIMLALAGPGTGKTFSISRRIKRIVEKNVPPEKILCLTFTDTAANEMRHAIASILDDKIAQKLNIYTYHSLCLDIIENNSEFFPEFSNQEIKIINEVTQYKLAKECIDELEPLANRDSKNNPYSKIIDLIKKTGEIKKNLINKENYFKNLENHPDWGEKLRQKEAEKQNCILNGKKITKKLETEITKTKEKIEKARELWDFYELYNSKMRNISQIDYNDMIALVLNKFESDEGFLEKIAANYEHILVDEYQDTSMLQNKIIFNLIDKMHKKNAFVVGDDDQTIYSFQGAHINNIGRFIEKYSKEENFKVVCLKENRRSTNSILEFSYDISTLDPLRLEGNPNYAKFNINKKLEAKNEKLFSKNKPPRFIEYFSAEREQNAIVEEIQSIINSKDCPVDENGEKKLNEIAIFAKTHKELALYAEKLKAKNIPYELKDGKSIFEIKSSVTLYFYLKFLSNPALYENYAFKLFLNPPFALDEKDFTKLYLKRHKCCNELLIDDIKNFLNENSLNKPEKLKNFIDTYEYLKKLISAENLRTVVLSAAQKTGIYSYFTECEINKSENIAGLKKILQTATEIMLENPQATCDDFINYLELSRENDFDILTQKAPIPLNAVQLSTYHSSKGREFEIVYMPNLKRSSWESNNKSTGAEIPTDEILNEDEKKAQKYSNEVKLMFVGLTRAKHTLNLSCAQNQRLGITEIIKPFLEKINYSIEDITTEKYENDIIQELEKKDFDYKKEFNDFISAILADVSYSPSAVNTYIKCPRRYLYSYILKLDCKSDFKDDANYGSAVHYALQKAYLFAKKEGKYPDKNKIFEYFKNKFDTLPISENAMRKIAESRAKESLEKFHGYFIQTPIENIFDCEFKLEGKIFDKIKFSAIIDRIELNQDNTLSIIDYKTGKKNASDFKINGLHQDYFMQLFLYKIFLENNSDIIKKVSKLKIILFDNPEESFEIPTDSISENEVQNLFIKAYENINSLDFEKNECATACKYCSFKDLCKISE